VLWCGCTEFSGILLEKRKQKELIKPIECSDGQVKSVRGPQNWVLGHFQTEGAVWPELAPLSSPPLSFFLSSLPLIYLTVSKLMLTSPWDHAPPPSSTPHSGDAATPEERRGRWAVHSTGLRLNQITFAAHTISKNRWTTCNSQRLSTGWDI